MKRETYIKLGISAAFTVAVYLFFKIVYPFHLHYHEEIQAFQFTCSYAAETIWWVGGLCNYISRFIIQFFYLHNAGPVIMATLMLALQLTTWYSCPTRRLAAYPLTCLPAIIFWCYFCNENAMLTVLVALCLSQLLAIGAVHLPRRPLRLAVALVGMPIAMFLLGPLAVLFPLLVLLHEQKLGLSTKALGCSLLAIAAIYVTWVYASSMLVPGSRLYIARGMSYYRTIHLTSYYAWSAALAAILVPMCAMLMPAKLQSGKSARVWAASLTLIMAVGCCIGLIKSVHMDKEEIMAYDYMSYRELWHKMIERADKQNPQNPYSVSSLNLALAMSGEMPERMFNYYQNGPEGLLGEFKRVPLSGFPTIEILWQLGFTNETLYYAYETNESVPDSQKSARALQRMAEAQIVIGNYEVARKYLQTLSSTLFYGDWAKQQLALLDDEEAINKHPLYGKRRQINIHNDFFHTTNFDEMLQWMLKDNPTHKMAYDYLMAHCLLEKDLEAFYKFYSLVNFGNRIPTSYQEALLLAWIQKHHDWKGMPWQISPLNQKRMESYIRDYQANLGAEGMLDRYGRNYWEYALYR